MNTLPEIWMIRKENTQITGKSAEANADTSSAAFNFPPGLAKPAPRALHAAGYTRLDQLATVTETELLALHGVDPKAIRILRAALHATGTSFAGSEAD